MHVPRSAQRPKLCPDPIDLGDGLVLRRGTREDRDKVVEFVSEIFGDQGPDDPPVRLGFAVYARNYFDHVEGAPHPTADWDSWTLVMDGQKLASCMLSIPETWTYGDGDDVSNTEGSPRAQLTSMRAELVGTDPAYRNKGLVRKQFAVHHDWAKLLDSPMQIIMGIRSYYRQFGYAYAMDLSGGRSGTVASLPPASAAVGYTLRRATKDDVQFLTETQRRSASRHALAYDWGTEEWNYALEGTFQPYHYWVAEKDGKRVAFVKVDSRWWTQGDAAEHEKGPSPAVKRIEIAEGQAWTAVVPAILRLLAEQAAAERASDKPAPKTKAEEIGQQDDAPIASTGTAGAREEVKVANSISELPSSWSYSLSFGPGHPAYTACAAHLPGTTVGFAYYVRFTLSTLFPIILPVLAHRLGRSPFAHHTGSLVILTRDRGDGGHELHFENGGVTYRTGEAPGNVKYKDRAGRGADVALFPFTTLYAIVTGYHGVGQVLDLFPDAAVCGRGRALMEVLFPKRICVGDSSMV